MYVKVYKLLNENKIRNHPYLEQKIQALRYVAPRSVNELRVLPFFDLTPILSLTAWGKAAFESAIFNPGLTILINNRLANLRKQRELLLVDDLDGDNGEGRAIDGTAATTTMSGGVVVKKNQDNLYFGYFSNDELKSFVSYWTQDTAVHIAKGLFHKMSPSEIRLTYQRYNATSDVLMVVLMFAPASGLTLSERTPLVALNTPSFAAWSAALKDKTGYDMTFPEGVGKVFPLIADLPQTLPELADASTVKTALNLQPMMDIRWYFLDCFNGRTGGHCSPNAAGLGCSRHKACQSGMCRHVFNDTVNNLWIDNFYAQRDDGTAHVELRQNVPRPGVKYSMGICMSWEDVEASNAAQIDTPFYHSVMAYRKRKAEQQSEAQQNNIQKRQQQKQREQDLRREVKWAAE